MGSESTQSVSSFRFSRGQFNSDFYMSLEENLIGKKQREIHLKNKINHLKFENITQRKPCKLCGNLVKPELLQQHYDAYHSS